MARKKKESDMQPPTGREPDTPEANGTASADTTADRAVPLEGHPEPPVNGSGTRRPSASWRYPAAAGVTVEVALWPNTITLQNGEQIEVFSATITRSYKDQSGQWSKGGSFRISEIPVLVHALMRAHAFALDAREMTCPL